MLFQAIHILCHAIFKRAGLLCMVHVGHTVLEPLTINFKNRNVGSKKTKNVQFPFLCIEAPKFATLSNKIKINCKYMEKRCSSAF